MRRWIERLRRLGGRSGCRHPEGRGIGPGAVVGATSADPGINPAPPPESPYVGMTPFRRARWRQTQGFMSWGSE